MAVSVGKIDKYGEVTLIAKGGMGAVYKAMHPTMDRPVVLKKLTLRGNATFAERFKREARILMDFHHDDIVTVYDHFKQGTSYYIVMEYVDGLSLEQLLKNHRYLDSPQAAYILLHTAEALSYAHSRGVIHRDIKPANILISRQGFVKLADFGIAASAEDEVTGLTGEGTTLGTPSYMAPEQFENSKYADARSDIYAVGAMTYEMTTGKAPFSGGFTPDLIRAKQKGRYRNPSKWVPEIAAPLRKVIRGAMRTSRKRRIQNTAQIIKKAERVLREYNKEEIRDHIGALVRGDDVPEKIKKRKRPGRIFSRVIISILAAGLAGWGLWSSTLIHPFIQGRTHARLAVSIAVPPAVSDRTVSVSIFGDEGNTITPSLFSLPGEEETLSTLPLFIPGGSYRIRVVSGTQEIWKSIYLPGYRKYLEETGRRIFKVNLGLSLPEKGKALVNYKVSDRFTGKDITSLSSLVLKDPESGSEVQLWQNAVITTGIKWAVSITADKYMDSHFEVDLQEGETKLTLEASLLPEPGTVKLEGFPPQAKLKLNGSEWADIYKENDGSGIVVRHTRISFPGEEVLLLQPGKYRLEFTDSGEIFTVDFKLGQGGKVKLKFDGNSLRAE